MLKTVTVLVANGNELEAMKLPLCRAESYVKLMAMKGIVAVILESK
jgi:hypothetical protein